MAQSQGQTEVFERAKQSMAAELGEAILSWNFSQMLAELRAVIAKKSPEERGRAHNSVRYFCRHYLGMHGNSFNDMRRWLAGEAVMPFEKIQLVLRSLKSERDGNLVPMPPNKGGNNAHRTKKEVIVKKTKESDAREVVRQEPKPEAPQPKCSGAVRKFVDHTTTVFNSLMVLGLELGVIPDNLYDGDRIQIRTAAKQIFDAFGIEVIFPESERAHSQPVTRQDFAEIGVKAGERKKRS